MHPQVSRYDADVGGGENVYVKYLTELAAGQ